MKYFLLQDTKESVQNSCYIPWIILASHDLTTFTISSIFVFVNIWVLKKKKKINQIRIDQVNS